MRQHDARRRRAVRCGEECADGLDDGRVRLEPPALADDEGLQNAAEQPVFVELVRLFVDEAAVARARREVVRVIEAAQGAVDGAVAAVVREDLRHAPRRAARGGGAEDGEREHARKLLLHGIIERFVDGLRGRPPARADLAHRLLLEQLRLAAPALPQHGVRMALPAGEDVRRAVAARCALHRMEELPPLGGGLFLQAGAALGGVALQLREAVADEAVLVDVERAARLGHAIAEACGVLGILPHDARAGAAQAVRGHGARLRAQVKARAGIDARERGRDGGQALRRALHHPLERGRAAVQIMAVLRIVRIMRIVRTARIVRLIDERGFRPGLPRRVELDELAADGEDVLRHAAERLCRHGRRQDDEAAAGADGRAVPPADIEVRLARLHRAERARGRAVVVIERIALFAIELRLLVPSGRAVVEAAAPGRELRERVQRAAVRQRVRDGEPGGVLARVRHEPERRDVHRITVPDGEMRLRDEWPPADGGISPLQQAALVLRERRRLRLVPAVVAEHGRVVRLFLVHALVQEDHLHLEAHSHPPLHGRPASQ